MRSNISRNKFIKKVTILILIDGFLQFEELDFDGEELEESQSLF